ncbi:MAG TPA: 16S rRNA (uracil(1498)-N(3))-methyltransferase [Pyrinomonadaceae bacterium]|jgi:16S rRNA (uracil1498-N3)-methyltransferase
MSRRRFYAPRGAFAADERTVSLAAEEARHLRDVLRLRRGEEVFVFDGEGREFRCEIEEYGRDGARLSVHEEVAPARPESPLRLTLALALLKGEKFDLVVQKATELGVRRIQPVETKLADVRLRDEQDAMKRTARWQRIALEAAKQSGRARLPEMLVPTSFTELVQSAASDGESRLMFSERDGVSLIEAAGRLDGIPESMTALVGSEGGWTDEEIKEALDAGWSIITLGGRVLRAETAAIIVTALLQHLFGDLR